MQMSVRASGTILSISMSHRLAAQIATTWADGEPGRVAANQEVALAICSCNPGPRAGGLQELATSLVSIVISRISAAAAGASMNGVTFAFPFWSPFLPLNSLSSFPHSTCWL